MNWQTEIIKLIEDYYKSIGIQYKPTNDVRRCLVDYLNLEVKLIKPVRRKIFISDKLKTRKIPTDNLQGLFAIDSKIQAGKDVTYHQSREAFNPSHNDPLLNDWLIHHLHLSDWKKSGDKFYERTQLVLFAIFTQEQAFFIDVRPHGKNGELNVFAKKELLEIVGNNWPSMLKEYVVEDAIMLSHNVTDEERAKARKRHMMLGMTEVNGKLIINPGIGVASSGHNVLVVRKADSVVRFVQDSLMEIEKDEEGMKTALTLESGIEIKALDICIHRCDGWPYFRVYEKNSKLYIDKNY